MLRSSQNVNDYRQEKNRSLIYLGDLFYCESFAKLK